MSRSACPSPSAPLCRPSLLPPLLTPTTSRTSPRFRYHIIAALGNLIFSDDSGGISLMERQPPHSVGNDQTVSVESQRKDVNVIDQRA